MDFECAESAGESQKLLRGQMLVTKENDFVGQQRFDELQCNHGFVKRFGERYPAEISAPIFGVSAAGSQIRMICLLTADIAVAMLFSSRPSKASMSDGVCRPSRFSDRPVAAPRKEHLRDALRWLEKGKAVKGENQMGDRITPGKRATDQHPLLVG